MKHEFLECGRVINKRGIGGELKVECYCDSTKSVMGTKKMYADADGKTAFDVVSLKDYNGFLYIKLSGVTTVEGADAMRGKVLYVNREDVKVDTGKNFVADLIGLKVIDADTGTEYGKVKDIQNFGASDIYVITDGNTDYYLPAVDGIIVETDIEDHILVRPIPGIFDSAEEIR
jgi:16S rRNA processing protein RimM